MVVLVEDNSFSGHKPLKDSYQLLSFAKAFVLHGKKQSVCVIRHTQVNDQDQHLWCWFAVVMLCSSLRFVYTHHPPHFHWMGCSMSTFASFLPCRFWRGSVMMPPAAAAATRLWMLVVGRERTSPCCPPRCPPALKGMRMGWFMPGAAPDITPPTALASCWATRRDCKTHTNTQEHQHRMCS